MVHQLCTVSDKSFLIKGLALYDSLLTNGQNFKLHYLCIDEDSYNAITQIQSPTLSAYTIDQITSKDRILSDLRAENYRYFCWSLASYFSNELLANNCDEITYVDSDIYFHQNFNQLFEEIQDADIGLFRHRMFELNENPPEGLFNVGVVHFKNTNRGKNALNWWAHSVKHRLYPHLATCGDQKYLDAIYKLTKKQIFVDGNVGHGAPWHWQLYNLEKYSNNGEIIWQERTQKLVFTHFSQFAINFRNKTYIPSTAHHNYTPLSAYESIEQLNLIYSNYYQKLLETKEKYRIKI